MIKLHRYLPPVQISIIKIFL